MNFTRRSGTAGFSGSPLSQDTAVRCLNVITSTIEKTSMDPPGVPAPADPNKERHFPLCMKLILLPCNSLLDITLHFEHKKNSFFEMSELNIIGRALSFLVSFLSSSL